MAAGEIAAPGLVLLAAAGGRFRLEHAVCLPRPYGRAIRSGHRGRQSSARDFLGRGCAAQSGAGFVEARDCRRPAARAGAAGLSEQGLSVQALKGSDEIAPQPTASISTSRSSRQTSACKYTIEAVGLSSSDKVALMAGRSVGLRTYTLSFKPFSE